MFPDLADYFGSPRHLLGLTLNSISLQDKRVSRMFCVQKVTCIVCVMTRYGPISAAAAAAGRTRMEPFLHVARRGGIAASAMSGGGGGGGGGSLLFWAPSVPLCRPRAPLQPG